MHLMIQEVLAAHYILQLPLDDQIEAFHMGGSRGGVSGVATPLNGQDYSIKN